MESDNTWEIACGAGGSRVALVLQICCWIPDFDQMKYGIVQLPHSLLLPSSKSVDHSSFFKAYCISQVDTWPPVFISHTCRSRIQDFMLQLIKSF